MNVFLKLIVLLLHVNFAGEIVTDILNYQVTIN